MLGLHRRFWPQSQSVGVGVANSKGTHHLDELGVEMVSLVVDGEGGRLFWLAEKIWWLKMPLLKILGKCGPGNHVQTFTAGGGKSKRALSMLQREEAADISGKRGIHSCDQQIKGPSSTPLAPKAGSTSAGSTWVQSVDPCLEIFQLFFLRELSFGRRLQQAAESKQPFTSIDGYSYTYPLQLPSILKETIGTLTTLI